MSATLLAPAFEVGVDRMRLAPEVAATFSSLSVVHELDSLDHFALTLANPFPDLPYTHGSRRTLFAPGAEVTIRLGYVDALEQVFDGEVTRVATSYGEQGSTITVEGHSRLHRLRGDTRTRSFLNATDGEIATAVALDAGLQAEVDRTETRYDHVVQANQSDYDFLLERARRIGFEVGVDGRSLLFRRRPDGSPSSLTLVWGDEQRAFAGPRSGPLLRFAPTLDATAPVTRVTVRGSHPTTREPIVGVAAAGDEADRGGTPGPDVVRQAFRAGREVTVVDRPVASQAEADAIARAVLNQRAQGLVRGSGATIGTPALRAGVVVELQGLGERFNGDYTVAQSTHVLDGSGYSTTFSAHRGSVG